MAADPSNPYVTRRELDDLLREELAAVRRETNAAIRELRDDLHTLAREFQSLPTMDASDD